MMSVPLREPVMSSEVMSIGVGPASDAPDKPMDIFVLAVVTSEGTQYLAVQPEVMERLWRAYERAKSELGQLPGAPE